MSRFQLGFPAGAAAACLLWATACGAGETPKAPPAPTTSPAPAPPAPPPASTPTPSDTAQEDVRAFFLTALSRGKGVPADALAVVKQAEEIVAADRQRGIAVTATRERLGIEGETRLCVTYQDVDPARVALDRIRKLAYGVELLNLEVGTCPPRKA